MDLFIGTGAPRRKVERFLDADLDGTGAVRDQIASDMTNQLLEMLGHRGRRTPSEVQRLRERGGWMKFGRRPPE